MDEQLPTGVLTFLFTDIEGSTTRWEHEPQLMRQGLVRHDEILRAAIEAHGGIVFKTVGDAFYAVFSQPADALAAALAAQRGALSEQWDARLGDVRVRMGIHTGQAERREGDYFGQPLNRVARLMAAGHGGQVLVSTATTALVADSLPAGVSVRDLGEHRLKDLLRPEHVYQLVAQGLPSDFPPLRTLDRLPNNLPIEPTPLLGRDRELAQLHALLAQSDVRLVTLLGPGGIGKTRLASQVAADLADEFPDGVFFIPLAAVSDGAFVLTTLAQTLGVHETAGEPLLQALRHYVQEKRLLLILDNLEQVIAPAAELAADLLSTAPELTLLATSRSPLRVRAEREYVVPPLALPDPRHLPPTIEELSAYASVQLFVERAVAAKADFALTPAVAEAVAKICVVLDGLPLALELAAARVKLLAPPALLQRLAPSVSAGGAGGGSASGSGGGSGGGGSGGGGSGGGGSGGGIAARLRMLTGGARDLPQRQRTLSDTIAWSYDLLSPDEQALFRRLSVFVAGWTLDAAEAVVSAAGPLSLDVLDGLGALMEQSLIRSGDDVDDPSGSGDRFAMLHVIREFGLLRLEEAGEHTATSEAHARYFLALVREASENARNALQQQWLDRVEVEHENVLAALAWARDTDHVELALNLSSEFALLWLARAHLVEGIKWLETVLARADAAHVEASTRAFALYHLGMLRSEQGANEAAAPPIRESLALYRAAGDQAMVARVLLGLGVVSGRLGGSFADAIPIWNESLELARQYDERLVPIVLLDLGLAFQEAGDLDRAERLLRETEALSIERGDLRVMVLSRAGLSRLLLDKGEMDDSWRLTRDALRTAHEMSLPADVATLVEYAAESLTARGEDERPARLAGVADAYWNEIGAVRGNEDEQAYQRMVATLRARMGDAAYDAVFVAGRAADREVEIAAVLAEGEGEGEAQDGR